MRYLRIIAKGLLGLGALFGLYVAFCVLPKITQSEKDLQTTPPAWVSSPVSLLGDWILDLIYILGVIVPIALLVALIPIIPEAIRNFAEKVISVIAWLGAAASIYLLTVGCAGMIYVNSDLQYRSTIYANILDQFALREEAEKKYEHFQEVIAHFNSAKLIDVQDVTALSREQANEQIKSILYGLGSSHDIAFLKQLLATSALFRKSFTELPWQRDAVLKAAATCGAPSDNIDNFYNWLEPRIGTDGWTKLPLHVLVFTR